MVTLEHDRIYNCGRRSLTFFLFKFGWLFFLVAALLLYIDFEMYFGAFNKPVTDFLNQHADWYVSVQMLSEWVFLLAISVIFVGYIRGKVLHRKIKFKIDEHAFHLREGLFMIKETTIPYFQISNVHIVRPYAYRFLGLSRLDILTVSDKDVLRRNSGNKLNDYLIPLIDVSIAKVLAQHLMKHASGIRPEHANNPAYNRTEQSGISDNEYDYDEDSEDEESELEDSKNTEAENEDPR